MEPSVLLFIAHTRTTPTCELTKSSQTSRSLKTATPQQKLVSKLVSDNGHQRPYHLHLRRLKHQRTIMSNSSSPSSSHLSIDMEPKHTSKSPPLLPHLLKQGSLIKSHKRTLTTKLSKKMPNMPPATLSFS